VEHEAQDGFSANHSESRKELDELDLVYGKKLRSPILGYHCQFPDLPTSCIPSITLDTSLLHVRFNDMHSLQGLHKIFQFYLFAYGSFATDYLSTIIIDSFAIYIFYLQIPIYAHLKVYDPKPVRLPEAPSIMSALQLQFS